MLPKLIFIALFAAVTFAADLPKDYESKTAAEKQDLLWANIIEKAYPMTSKLPTEGLGALTMLNVVNPWYLSKAFTNTGDEMQAGRKKIIHTYGSVAKVTLEINSDSKYTGLFKAGSKNLGLARLSLAKQDEENFIPGFALKFFADHSASRNIIAMYSTAGQGVNKNFFANPFTNYIPDAEGFAGFVVGGAFHLALGTLPGKNKCDKPIDEGKLPQVIAANVEADGTTVPRRTTPIVLVFTPASGVGWDPKSNDDFRKNLDKIKEGTTLYTLSVKDSRESTDLTEIGKLVTTSNFVASQYGDENLYFQHHAKSC